jgi:signal transduction histidine kinase/ActR/RegA family two-component response regulator
MAIAFLNIPFAAVWGFSAAQTSSVIMWIAAVVVPAILFHHGRRQPVAIRKVYVLVAVIAASLGLAHAMSSLPLADSSLGVLLTAATAMIALCAAATLLRRLPHDIYEERTISGDDFERLRLLEAAVTASGDGVMIAEATTDFDHAPRIAFANPAFSRMMGYSAEETLGLSPSIFCHTDSAVRRFGDGPPVPDPETDAEQEALETIRHALRGTEPVQLEMPSRRKDGTRMWAEWQIVPVAGDDDRITHWVAILRDTTERRRLESQLRESQKMDAIGRLAGGIAHDFNNLLTVIHGNAELLIDDDLDSDVSAELIQDIRCASDRAAGLVRQLLTFGRRQPARPEVVDLNLIVNEMAGLLRRVLGEHVCISTNLAPSPVRARADRSQLEQVVMNLAVNARDAMPNGGTLTITTSCIQEGAGEKLARLLVADTGTGMTPEVRARIFEPFFTTKGPAKGTGLGLATVYGIVKQNGGQIGVDSAPGVGSAFRAEFPWCDDPPGSSSSLCLPISQPARNPQVGCGRSILLCEDEPAVRKMARAALEGCGYSVTEADCAEAALEHIEAGISIDLLVTDLTMPGIGGRELAARVRTERPEVGVVFISGYAPDASWLDDVPGAVFLPKPFTPTDLLRSTGKSISRVAKLATQPV